MLPHRQRDPMVYSETLSPAGTLVGGLHRATPVAAGARAAGSAAAEAQGALPGPASRRVAGTALHRVTMFN